MMNEQSNRHDYESEFTLEDIMKEFGSGGNETDAVAVQQGLDEEFPTEATQPEKPAAEAEQPEAEREPVPAVPAPDAPEEEEAAPARRRGKRRGLLRRLLGPMEEPGTIPASEDGAVYDEVEPELDDGSDEVVYVFPDPEDALRPEPSTQAAPPEPEAAAAPDMEDAQEPLDPEEFDSDIFDAARSEGYDAYDAEEEVRPRGPGLLHRLAAWCLVHFERMSQPPAVRTTDEAARAYSAGSTAAKRRTAICFVLFLLTALLTLLQGLGVPLTKAPGAMSWILLVFLLLSAAAAFEILKRGAVAACTLRFRLESLLLLAVVVEVAECVAAAISGRLCFAAVVCAALFFAVWGDRMYQRGMYRTIRTLQKTDAARGVVTVPESFEKKPALFCAAGSESQFMAHVEEATPVEKSMRIYAPAAAIVTLALAVFAAVRGHANFIWAWSAMLSAAIPLGSFVCYTRPLYLLSRRLAKKNAALCAWYGAKSLERNGAILLKDTDLFPKGSVRLNGVKTFGGYRSGQVLGCAAAVLEQAQCGLAPLLLEQLELEGGRHLTAEELRWYSDGGVGGTVGQNTVLIGTYSFMRKMGVHMLENTKVRQALYISINGELAGLVAARYAAAVSVKNALRMVDKIGRQSLVMATCNPVISPSMLRSKFEIRGRKLVCPAIKTRAALAQSVAGEGGVQCGILERDSFGTLANMAAGGRMLRLATWFGLLVALLGGMMGIGVMFTLSLVGATTTLTALNLLLFSMIWVVPSLLLSGWTRTY